MLCCEKENTEIVWLQQLYTDKLVLIKESPKVVREITSIWQKLYEIKWKKFPQQNYLKKMLIV